MDVETRAMRSHEDAQPHDVNDENQTIIRRFTDELEDDQPNDSLTSSLKLAVDEKDKELELAKPWRSQYEAPIPVNPEDADLNIQCEIVDKQWKNFRQRLEEEQQVELEKRSKWKLKKRPKKELQVDGKEKPTATDVIEVVKNAEKVWKEKERLGHGKVQHYFNKFCNKLGQHKSMLEVLPTQSEYFSVLCGAISTLINASANHQKTAQGLGRALNEITDDLDSCVNEVKLMPTDDMKEAVSNIYLDVFYFLNSALQWFSSGSWRKVMNSLNEDFYDTFSEQLQKIKRKSELLLQRGSQKSRYEQRDVRTIIEQEAERNHQERLANREERLLNQIWRKEIGRAMSHLMIGRSMYETAESNMEAWRYRKDSFSKITQNGLKARTLSIEYEDPSPRRLKQRPRRCYQRSKLEQWSRYLDRYTSNVSVLLESVVADIETADKEVVEQLQAWGASTTSQSLWVRGAFETRYPSSTTAIATKVVASAQSLGVPIICYLCSTPRACSRDNALAEETVIDFLYSLLRQIIYVLPPEFETSANISKSRFDKLNGEMESFDIALDLLERLITLAPKTLLVVIDGLEQLDQSVVEEDVDDVLRIILESVTSSARTRDQRLLKTLFTTAGQCNALENFDEDFLTTVEPRRGPPKRRRKRGVRLADFDLSDMDEYEID